MKLKSTVQPNYEAARTALSEATAKKDNAFEQVRRMLLSVTTCFSIF